MAPARDMQTEESYIILALGQNLVINTTLLNQYFETFYHVREGASFATLISGRAD